jgi:hypothetical protein
MLFAAGAAAVAGNSNASGDRRAAFLFFWGLGCPHCVEARPFVQKLEKEHPERRFESWEVNKDPQGRRRFADEVKRLGIPKPVVPTFVCGNDYVAGFTKGSSESLLRDLARRCP